MTDNTPIQFSNDDRLLLRQIAGIVQESHFRLSALEVKVSALDVKVSALDVKVSALEVKVDERLHDTRPMWEALNNRLDRFEAETRERFDRIEARLDKIEARLDKIEARLDRVEATLDQLEREIKDLKTTFRHFQRDTVNRQSEIEDRLENLEKPEPQER